MLAKRLGAAMLIETTADHPFLDAVYVDDDRHDLQIELAFLLLHFGGYRSAPRDRVVVSDFSPAKDLLFAWDMLRGDDLRLFERVYEKLYSDVTQPDIALFLDVPPEVCLDRIRRRGRSFESGVTLDRLRRMDALYRRHTDRLGGKILRVPVGPGHGPAEVVEALASALADASTLGVRA
jgi:deoxyadenosine/deoxycytidine kinase